MPAPGAADGPRPRSFWLPVICGAAILTIGIGARQSFGIFQKPIAADLKVGRELWSFWFACGPRRYHEILERLKANGVSINAGPLLVIPPAIHSFYFFDPNGIRLEITSDLDGDEEDLQVIRSCSMTETELRAELETISSDRAWIDEMVAAMTRDEIGSRDTPLPRG